MRFSVISIIAIVVILALMVLWSKRNGDGNSGLRLSTTVNTVTSNGVVSEPPAIAPAKSNSEAVGDAGTATNLPAILANRDKVSLLKGILEANDVDIVFYGRLTDQFGVAIPYAKVNFGVHYYNVSGQGVTRGQVTSDDNGFFRTSRYKGQNIDIVPAKEGYVPLGMQPGSGNYSFQYPENERAHPDANNPVLVKMWKLQGAQALTGIDKVYKCINCPTRLRQFDLI